MRNGSLLLVLLIAQTATAQRANYEVALKSGHFLDAKFVWGEPANDEFSLPVDIKFGTPGETVASRRWNDAYKSPFASIKLYGKFWIVLDEFVSNPGIVWNFSDRFFVASRDHKSWKIDRAELAEFPALASRFHAAKFSFQRLEIHCTAMMSDGYQRHLALRLDANDFIIPSEGQKPVMAPASPLKWSEKVYIEGMSGFDKEEEFLPSRWKQITAIRNARIEIIGLNLPTEELVSIAEELERRKKDLTTEKERYASVLDGGTPPEVKPFSGVGPEAEPFEETQAEVYEDKQLQRVGLMSHGRLLAVWSSRDRLKPEPLIGKRYFWLPAYDSKQGAMVVDRRGQPMLVGGQVSFDRVEKKDGKVMLVKVLDQGFERTGACAAVHPAPRTYSSYSEAESAAMTAVYAGQRADSLNQAAARAQNDRGLVLCGFMTHFRIATLHRLTIDDALRVLDSRMEYEIW